MNNSIAPCPAPVDEASDFNDAEPRMLRDLIKANPDAYKFGDIQDDRVPDPEAEVPIQRILGGYLPVPDMLGFYTRELKLRQEIELADRQAELRNLEGMSQALVLRTMLPICKLILFRRNADGDIVQCNEDDLLDNFRSVQLLALVREVTGLGSTDESDESPTPALPTTEALSAE